jgi:uncharacterized membrane protein YcaP (DUF421 family)
MKILIVLASALFAYTFLLVFLRLKGKRFILQATPFDLVLAVALGEHTDKFLSSTVSMSQYLVATLTLFVLHSCFHVSP